jgi:hypothetical protein
MVSTALFCSAPGIANLLIGVLRSALGSHKATGFAGGIAGKFILPLHFLPSSLGCRVALRRREYPVTNGFAIVNKFRPATVATSCIVNRALIHRRRLPATLPSGCSTNG